MAESTPLAARPKAWVCGHTHSGTAGSNPYWKMDVLSFLTYCEVEVCSSGWSLVQRSPTECGVSECERGTSIIRTACSTGGCWSMGAGEVWLSYTNTLLEDCMLPGPALQYHMLYVLLSVALEFLDWTTVHTLMYRAIYLLFTRLSTILKSFVISEDKNWLNK